MPKQLTSWSRVLPEKQIGLQIAKKFLAFYEILMFITTLTAARQLSLF